MWTKGHKEDFGKLIDNMGNDFLITKSKSRYSYISRDPLTPMFFWVSRDLS